MSKSFDSKSSDENKKSKLFIENIGRMGHLAFLDFENGHLVYFGGSKYNKG